ncbi:RNA polymerase sigma factor SigX [Thalassobacillus pellis]|uniref:RNA polymerase sigma factor SigX n=1 Tax=Thalassobacillus pellis TaxID=748008 RepID=UPI00195FAF45|nr:RNA polymerase sigma-70 factor (ECF subfamily) [Thalassobacillus pellis]
MRSVYERFYDQYHTDLYRFVFYMVKDREQAEDLVQDVYIRVINSYSRFNGESSEKTWLFSIARHVTIDYFRKQKRKKKRLMDFFDWSNHGEQLQDERPLPDEIIEQGETIREVYRCMEQLTVDQKSVIVLRYIQSMSIQETADILGWSASKVKTTQHRGMKALQRQMEKQREEEKHHEQ